MPEKTKDDTTKDDTTKDDTTKDDTTKDEITTNKEIIGEINMDESKKKSKLDLVGEFSDTIVEQMNHKEMLVMGAFILDNYNPVERIFKYRTVFEEEALKELVENFTKANMPSYLQAYADFQKQAYGLGLDMFDYHRTISQRRKSELER